MDILINQILAKATDLHTVDLKTRRTEGTCTEVDFVLTLSGRMPIKLFADDDADEGDDGDDSTGPTFLNVART